jgi:hypothetical protein
MLAASILLLAIAACGDDGTGPTGDPQNFSGNYTLVSFAQGNDPPVAGAAGTFTLTATTYVVSIDVPGGVPPHVDDQGTYTATGTATAGNWTQQSTVSILQSTGTYAWDASTNRLTLDTMSFGQRSVLVLQRI